jgi:hypothetical protein
MLTRELKDSSPVQFPSRRENDMCDIGSVETLAPSYKELRRQRLLWGQHSGRDPADLCWTGTIDPRIVNHQNAVTHSSDEIDKVAAPVHLREPNGIANFVSEAPLSKNRQNL